MKDYLRPAIVVFLALTIVTGIAYPMLVTACAQAFFRNEANGSFIRAGDKIVGSELIGQPFDRTDLFWSRPSATGPHPYNAAASTGSNLGPTNPDWLKAVGERVEAIKKAHPDRTGPVPADLVTASASGLDPHITPAAARYQAKRVADARGKSEQSVLELIDRHVQGRTFGVLGEPRVNVLKLNLALDIK
ncbi:MAG: potassium-transporting ATPase subunit KdpC [Gemmataceae bacterium]|nr:potassium-transporting ATPase subunit KdpC [Gemmataceae bacterium]